MSNRQARRHNQASIRRSERRGPRVSAPGAARAEIAAALAAFRSRDAHAVDFAPGGFDAAWLAAQRATAEELADGFPGFRRWVFDQASRVPILGRARDGSTRVFMADLFVCPFIGVEEAVLAFAADPERLTAVADSFHRHGMLGDDGMAIVLPVPVAPEALSVDRTGPAALRGLSTLGAKVLLDIVTGRADPPLPEVRAAMSACVRTRPLRRAAARPHRMVTGAFAVVRVEPEPQGAAAAGWTERLVNREEPMEARADAWIDDGSFRDPGFVLMPPNRWCAAAAALACRRAHAMMAAEADNPMLTEDGGTFRELHCARDPASGNLHVAARSGAATSGVHEIPATAWTADPDTAWGILREISRTLTEHATPGSLRAALAA